MSEQPKRFEHWGVDLPDGSQDIFLDLAEAQAAVDDALSDDDEDVRGITHYVELREGESIIGPEERAVIEAAVACQSAHDEANQMRAKKATKKEMDRTAKAYSDAFWRQKTAVRALREARK